MQRKEAKGEAERDLKKETEKGPNSKNALRQVPFEKCAITVCVSDSVSAKVDEPVELLRNFKPRD